MEGIHYTEMSGEAARTAGIEIGRALSMGGAMAVMASLLAGAGASKAVSGPMEMLWRFVTTTAESINGVGVVIACMILGVVVYLATYIPLQNTWPDVEDRPHDVLFTSFQISKILWMAVVLFVAWLMLSAIIPDSSSVGRALRRGVNDSVENSARVADLFVLCLIFAVSMYLAADLPYFV